MLADAGQVEREAALVGADVEGAAGSSGLLGVCSGGGVVQALIEEGAGLLAGGVEVEAQAVEGEDGVECGFTAADVERRFGCGRQMFEFADAGVGALDDGVDPGLGGEDVDEDLADVVLRGALGEQLHDDERVVAVGDDAGERVGFGEDEAAG